MDQEQENKSKKCFSCNKYFPFYTKGYCHFVKRDCGMCKADGEKITNKHDTCEKWLYNNRNERLWSRRRRRETALKCLTGIMDNLSEVSQILKEEVELNKIDPIEYYD